MGWEALRYFCGRNHDPSGYAASQDGVRQVADLARVDNLRSDKDCYAIVSEVTVFSGAWTGKTVKILQTA